MQDDVAAKGKCLITLALDVELLEQGRQADIDLTELVERALCAELARQRSSAQWREENRATIEAWNEDVHKNGLWSDGLRTF